MAKKASWHRQQQGQAVAQAPRKGHRLVQHMRNGLMIHERTMQHLMAQMTKTTRSLRTTLENNACTGGGVTGQ